jgi:hypothetical protein
MHKGVVWVIGLLICGDMWRYVEICGDMWRYVEICGDGMMSVEGYKTSKGWYVSQVESSRKPILDRSPLARHQSF